MTENVRENSGTMRSEIGQPSHNAASYDLKMPLANTDRKTMLVQTVDAMAAGTFAMMDMTAFKFMSMKIVAIKLAKNLW